MGLGRPAPRGDAVAHMRGQHQRRRIDAQARALAQQLERALAAVDHQPHLLADAAAVVAAVARRVAVGRPAVQPVAAQRALDMDDTAMERRGQERHGVGADRPVLRIDREIGRDRAQPVEVAAAGRAGVVAEPADDRHHIAVVTEIGHGAAERPALGVDQAQRVLDLGGAVVGRGQTGRDRVRIEQVVGVEPDDPFAARRLDAEVVALALADVDRLAHHPHPVRVARDHLGRIVGRAVVDDDDLAARRGLRQRRLDGRRDEATVVVVQDDDRDRHR